jgi:DNA-binding NarL/FixJ family response regulator
LIDAGGKVRVVVVDDHTLFRQGISEMLGTDPQFAVVAEGASGHEAVSLVSEHRPDVVLLDVEMPGPGAKATVRQLRKVAADTQIVVLTMHDDPNLVHELLGSGVSAYLLKTIGRDELIAAVRAVAHNSRQVLLSVSRETIESLDGVSRPDRSPLSARELEVLRLLAQAMSNDQIARRLFISRGTVKRHLSNIYGKLGAVSRVDAVRKALAAGLIRQQQ